MYAKHKVVLSRIVGRWLAPAEASGMEYTSFGNIAEQQLLSLEDRYEYLSVDKYVIMPNHIHVVLILESDAAGASPIDGNLRGKKEYPYLLKMC